MARSKYKTSTEKRKPTRSGSGGKVGNDHNRAGLVKPTQLHQDLRTPVSRDDRQSQLGADNQSHMRKGGVMAPRGGRSH